MTGQPNSTRFYQEEIENVTLQLTQTVDEKTRGELETRLRVAKQYLALPTPTLSGTMQDEIHLLAVEQGGHVSSLTVNQ